MSDEVAETPSNDTSLVGKRPTSFDVAREAGVSQTTVSLVLRGADRGRVGSATVDRVMDAANRLGYRPNEAGRSLRGAKSRLIGFAVPDVADPYFTTVMSGAEERAWASNHLVGLLAIRGEESISRLVDAVLGSWMEGLVICGPTPEEVAGLAPVADRTVVLDGDAQGMRASISYDVQGGMAAAIDHLLELGHRVIGQVTSTSVAQTVRRRQDAFEELRPGAPRVAVTYKLDVDRAAAVIGEFLAANADITALVCDTDNLAADAVAACADRGLSVPDDVSIVGFNDSEIAKTLRPTLTSVALPAARAGELAVELLTESRLETTNVILDTRLVVRDSTAPHRRD